MFFTSKEKINIAVFYICKKHKFVLLKKAYKTKINTLKFKSKKKILWLLEDIPIVS